MPVRFRPRARIKFKSLARPKQKVYALDVVLFPLLHALSGGEGRERRAFKYCVCFCFSFAFLLLLLLLLLFFCFSFAFLLLFFLFSFAISS